jgi:cysteine desulfurase
MNSELNSPIYLDCAATTPIDGRVAELVTHYLCEEFGNAGSRTHEYGARAKRAVTKAREQVAAVGDARPDEVVFTSGATESNNLAILGLADWASGQGKKHLVSTAIEHKAVLEPVEEMQRRGFEVTLVSPNEDGRIEPETILGAVRSDTALVSIMHVNNETGVIQPIEEIAELLRGHEAYLHVDAAQGFGKDLDRLQNKRVDLISASAHKIYGPKGIGALITRRRRYDRPPLRALMLGGGQERGLRPGTLPVHALAGFGLAAELALAECSQRIRSCASLRDSLLKFLAGVSHEINGSPEHSLPNVLNVSFEGIDSEAAMVALKGRVAISNGSACTSQDYSRSHVLEAMRLPAARIDSALRISWCHETTVESWADLFAPLATQLRRVAAA